MPELRPDDQQLRLQGQVNQLTSPPPMPQVNTFVPNAETTNRGRFGAFTNQLGDVLANQALERQRLVNQGMISNALISAQSAMNDLYDQQIQRKGFNVFAQPATDTEDAKDDINTVFSTGMSEIVSSINAKFTNDYQREQFNRTFAPMLIAKTDDLGRYYNDQVRQATNTALDSNIKLMLNDAQGYIYDGELDKSDMTLANVRSLIRDTVRELGGAPADAQLMFDNYVNDTVSNSLATLNERGEYDLMSQVLDRYGTLVTGNTRNRLNNLVGNASLIGQAKQTAESVFEAYKNDPLAKDPTTGLWNVDFFLQKIEDAYDSSTTVVLETQSHAGGSNLFNSGNTMQDAFTAIILSGEKTRLDDPNMWTVESSAKAIGPFQIIPSTWRAFAPKAGLSPDADRTNPENQIRVKNAMIKYAIDKGINTPEAFAVFWHNGETDAFEYMQNPNDPKWDEVLSDGITTNEYIARAMENYNEFLSNQGMYSGKKPFPTAELPQNIEFDVGLANTQAGIKSTLPYVGGIIKQITGTVDGAYISGGARTPAQNASVNGEATSYHLNGNAVDIVLPPTTTSEQSKQIEKAIKDTGLFDEVLYHDVGSGLHLHVAGYRGGLDTWLTNAGYSPTASQASYHTRTLNITSPVAKARAVDLMRGIISRANAPMQNFVGQTEQSLMRQSWTDITTLKQRVDGITYPDGSPLPPQLKNQIVNSVWRGNPNSYAMMQQEIADARDARAYTRENRARAEASRAFDEGLAQYQLNGGDMTIDAISKQPWYLGGSWAKKNTLVQSIKAQNTPMLTAQDRYINSVASQAVKNKYGASDVIKENEIKEYVEARRSQWLSEHNGQLPPSKQIEMWVQRAIAQPSGYNSNNWFGSDTTNTWAGIRSWGEVGVNIGQGGRAMWGDTELDWSNSLFKNGMYGIPNP